MATAKTTAKASTAIKTGVVLPDLTQKDTPKAGDNGQCFAAYYEAGPTLDQNISAHEDVFATMWGVDREKAKVAFREVYGAINLKRREGWKDRSWNDRLLESKIIMAGLNSKASGEPANGQIKRNEMQQAVYDTVKVALGRLITERNLWSPEEMKKKAETAAKTAEARTERDNKATADKARAVANEKAVQLLEPHVIPTTADMLSFAEREVARLENFLRLNVAFQPTLPNFFKATNLYIDALKALPTATAETPKAATRKPKGK